MMLFANRKGILVFDGVEWITLKIPVIPYAMQKNPYDQKIYVGGENKFGVAEKDESGSYRFFLLSSDSSYAGMITKIVFDGVIAWFYSDQTITRFNIQKNKIDLRLVSGPGHPFAGMFVTKGNTFINVFNKGLHKLKNDSLLPEVSGYLTRDTEILFSLPCNSNLVLLGLGNNTLRLFDGSKYYDYLIKDEGYLKENILSEGIALSDTAYAFSTLEGGAIVVEKSSRKILFTINNQSELPDDEVFALGSDNTGGLWLSHQYGLTRADLKLPVSNYSIFPGLKGNLSSVIKHRNELYVASSEGVFYLSEVRNYDEKEIIVQSIPEPTVAEEHVQQGTDQNDSNTRKNIFSRIFGRKTDQQKVVPSGEPSPVKPKVTYSRRKISKLKSIDYAYRKVQGLNDKCRQLVSTPEGILAATNRGLYLIDQHKADIIMPDRYINNISWSGYEGRYYAGTSGGYITIGLKNGKWMAVVPDTEFIDPVYSVFPIRDKTLWFGSDNSAIRSEVQNEAGKRVYNTYTVRRDFPERYTLDLINDTVFLFSENGIYFHESDADSFYPYHRGLFNSKEEPDYYFPLSNHRLVKLNDKWIEFGSSAVVNETELALLKVFDDIVSVYVEKDQLWVIEGNNRLYAINRKGSSAIDPMTNIVIKSISNQRGISFNIGDVKLDRGDNVLIFNIVAPGYVKQNSTRYQYFVERYMETWSPWSLRTNYIETVTKPGNYLLQVRAMDIFGNVGEPESVSFTISAPFTRTPLFYVLAGLLFLLMVILAVRLNQKQLYRKNRLLEEKVRERTSEIEARKKEITSSIEYAGRIQRAILPVEDHFGKLFSDHFILYKPRDIVSGDFYWIGENDKAIYFTVADCTGHGVPGAFMSTMGISALNEIVANNRNLQANKVLNLLRKKIVNALHQTGVIGETADGMDIAFCTLNKDRTKLQFSGAFNPLVIFQGGEFREYKGDRMPIGIHYGKEISFTNHLIDVNQGDTIFLFSDGYASQFGGPDGSKYKKSNFKKLLSEIYFKPMVEQRNILSLELDKWKGSLTQVDDVTILGLRI